MPYYSYRKHHPADDEHFIGAMAAPGQMAEAQDEIRGVLRRRRHVPYSAPDNFGLSTAQGNHRPVQGDHRFSRVADRSGQLDWIARRRRRSDEHHADVGHAAHPRNRRAERRRRRAAATSSGNFSPKPAVSTGAGGVIGVLLGFSSACSSMCFLPRLPSSVPLWAVALAVGVWMSVGLFFGIYPAVRQPGSIRSRR